MSVHHFFTIFATKSLIVTLLHDDWRVTCGLKELKRFHCKKWSNEVELRELNNDVDNGQRCLLQDIHTYLPTYPPEQGLIWSRWNLFFANAADKLHWAHFNEQDGIHRYEHFAHTFWWLPIYKKSIECCGKYAVRRMSTFYLTFPEFGDKKWLH